QICRRKQVPTRKTQKRTFVIRMQKLRPGSLAGANIPCRVPKEPTLHSRHEKIRSGRKVQHFEPRFSQGDLIRAEIICWEGMASQLRTTRAEAQYLGDC